MDRLLTATHRVEAQHFWFRGLRRFLVPLVAQAAGGRPNARLLDCGCGTGVNLPLLSRFGAVAAVDLNAYGNVTVESLAQRLGIADAAARADGVVVHQLDAGHRHGIRCRDRQWPPVDDGRRGRRLRTFRGVSQVFRRRDPGEAYPLRVSSASVPGLRYSPSSLFNPT